LSFAVNECCECCIDEGEISSSSTESDDESLSAAITQERRGQRVLAVPAVRRIAMENKVPTAVVVCAYSSQLRASVLLVLELLFIRDGSFGCFFLSSHEIDEFIDIVCTF